MGNILFTGDINDCENKQLKASEDWNFLLE